MPHRKIVVLTLAVILCTSLCVTAAMGQHSHSVIGAKISGMEHPERIPDAVAFRLWITGTAMAQDATEERKAVQPYLIGGIHLNQADQGALVTRLAAFRLKYDEAIVVFNIEATAADAHQQAPNTALFLSKINKLINDAQTSLATSLSAKGYAQLVNHIQQEKSGMTIDASEAQ
jgi:hypothetical protein